MSEPQHNVEGLEMTETKPKPAPKSHTSIDVCDSISNQLKQSQPYDACSYFLIILSCVFTIVTFPLTCFFCFKCATARSECPQLAARFAQILSKDSVTVNVDAVVYFRVCNATVSIVNVENATGSTKLLAQTTLRNVLGTKTLSEMLSHREEISAEMQKVLDQATEHWGVKVERVEVKDIRLPTSLQRAMAAEAEANREAKAKVIAADGERLASESLRTAATVLSETPAALQLRYLQTLNTISAEHNSTIIFPLPMDLLGAFLNYRPSQPQPAAQPTLHPTPTFATPHQPPTYESANPEFG